MSRIRKIVSGRRVRYVAKPSGPLSGTRIYIACPISVYPTPRYERLMTIVRRQFPDAVILEARDLYSSTVDWRRRWPSTLRTLTHLVFFCDPDGWIGRGVWTEIGDVTRAGLTVLHVSDRGRVTPRTALRFGPPNESCLQRFCLVVVLDAER